MTGVDIPLTSVISNWDRGTSTKGVVIERDGGLQIEGSGPFSFIGLGGKTLFSASQPQYRGISNLSEARVLGLVSQCQQTWREQISDFSLESVDEIGATKKSFPFLEKANLSEVNCSANIAQLAIAGTKLFQNIFFAEADENLKEIGQILVLASKDRSLALTITSENFFVPWRMFYTHPDGKLSSDGSNWVKEGFWGYRHVIEHNTRRFQIKNELLFSKASDVSALLCLDEQLTDSQNHIKDLNSLAFQISVVKNKSELQKALSASPCLNDLMYFFCHGTGNNNDSGISLRKSELFLSREAITPEDIGFWRTNSLVDFVPFEKNPLIFINACQTGQDGSFFYQGFVREFLRCQASTVLGPQIDIPAVFATFFISRMLQQFFSASQDSQPRPQLGNIVRSLTRLCFDQYNNPLGIAYSMYRGMDLTINWSEQ